MPMYQVVESVNGKHETYMIGFETEAELTKYLNGKRIWINEKKDSVMAWKVNADGTGYIDLERLWKLYSRKAM